MLVDRQMKAGTTQVDFEVDRPPPADSRPDLLITMVKETIILYKKSFQIWKKSETCSYLSLIWKWWKRENDCEIACDCVKRANMVLGLCICKEIFSSKHAATHKPTSAQPLIVTTMTDLHLTRELVAVAPRRPPMTDIGTETAFRLDQRKHFQKSKHLLRSEVSWCDQTSIDLHLRRSTSTSTCE